jgi:hypothetical protein
MFLPVAIPTYRRSQAISHQTLNYLKDQGCPPELVTLFVASEDEKQEYLKNVPSDMYGKIVVGVLGLANQRNFISEYYDEGELVLEMDDDVCGIKSWGGQSLEELLHRATACLEDGKGGLWGVLPNDDGRRFTFATTEHLTHILGSFFVLRNHRELKITNDEGEDYERSILYFQKYGRVYRYRGAGVKTTFNKGSGGLLCSDREDKRRRHIQDLGARFPKACSVIMKKDKIDVRLNWRYSVESELTQDEAGADA